MSAAEISLEEFRDQGSGVSLEELRSLQLQKGQRPPSVKANGGQRPPPTNPYPSNRRKEELFQLSSESCARISNKVSGLVPTVDEDWQTFADRLMKECGCEGELEKVRAAFEWVGRADPVKATEGPGGAEGRRRDSPLDILVRCRQEKLFSALFQRLIAYAGVEYELIRGYKKGTSYRIGERIDEARDRGLWFAVFVAGEWRLIDAHWGCCHVAGENSGEWNRIADDGRVQKATRSQGTMVYTCNETYFLTDPWKMIFKHFPERPEWQLVPQPLTLQQFEQLPYMFPELLEDFGLRLVSHKKAVALVPESGELLIKFEETGATQEYTALLYIHTGSLANSDTIDFQRKKMKLARFAALKRDGKQLEVAIFPPKTGKYLLVLQGHSNTLEYAMPKVDLVHYVLHCDKISRHVAPLPETKVDEWGLGAKAEKIGVTAVSHHGAEIRLIEGEETLQFRATSLLEYRCELRNRDDPNPLAESEPLVWRDGDLDLVHVVAPGSGTFGLSILARRQGESGDSSFQPVGDFLLEADVGATGPWPLPPGSVLGGVLGIPVNEQATLKDAKQSPKDAASGRPYIKCTEPELRLSWRHEETARLRCELLRYSAGQLSPLPGFAFTQAASDNAAAGIQETEFRVRFRENGSHVLRIYDAADRSVFTYLLRCCCKDLDGLALEFPTAASDAWRPPFCLVDGFDGHLLPGSDASVSLRPPKTIRTVLLRRPGHNEALSTLTSDGGNGSLTAKIPTDVPGDKFELIGEFADGTEARLLSYAVMTPEEVRERERRAEEATRKKTEQQKPQQQQQQQQYANKDETRSRSKSPSKSRFRSRSSGSHRSRSPTRRQASRSRSRSSSRSRSRSRSRSQTRSRPQTRSRTRSRSPSRTRSRSRSRTRSRSPSLTRSRSRSRTRSRSPSRTRSRSRSRSQSSRSRSRSSSSDSGQVARGSSGGAGEGGRKVATSMAEERERKRQKAKDRRALRKHCRNMMFDALRQKKLRPLKTALEEWEANGQSLDDELYQFAKRFQRMLQLKEKLNNGIEQAKAKRNKAHIREVLDEIEDEFFSEDILVELSSDMRKANDVYKRFDRIEKISVKPLAMDEKAKLELSCYSKPDQSIHSTVMAVLLLMGYYEKRTRKWKRCQPIIKTLKLSEFNRLDPASVHPAIAARSREITLNLDIKEVAIKSAAAAAFFDWAQNVVAAVGDLNSDSDTQPASIKQQKKILNVSPEEDADMDWEDKGKRAQTAVRGRRAATAKAV